MVKIYLEICGDINLKQAFVSSLPKLLASRTMTIIEEKFQSITIPQIGYIRQAIFVALDDIYQWVPHFKDFNTASNAVLTTTVITKHPVTIEFFPGLKYRTKLLGSDVPGKDLIIGFDIYRQLRDQLQIKANGIAFKKQFRPYSEIPRLFQITDDEQIKEIEQNLIEHSCAESHKDFMKEGKHPLWKN
uniref:Uncharacterized protein LOC104235734 n=1 Tax=Nicotiana sylvestris TaxID=4096 RepID=A0A1U7XDW4_NICSY|nr:PREDICTED: uncharacterized protein LOC104235734 [Nicotiana sylvestris]